MANTTVAKIVACSLLLAISMQMCTASAIPIWEFLTRNEKMSYLYSTFAQLVSVHCKATATASATAAAVPVNQCKRNLLSYGYEKLQTFTDGQLDAFDPYQRGANELIWSSIMRDHPSSTLITTRTPLPTPPASSLIILTHQQPLKPSTPVSASTVPVSHQQYPQNPLFNGGAEHKHKYAMDMDIAYGYPSMPTHHSHIEIFDSPNNQQEPHTSSSAHHAQHPKTYLTGPLVFRLRPDGTPVEEDLYRPLPRDDDLEVFRVSPATSEDTAPSGRPNKHRKIATISALKQQRLATLALQQQLQPPLEQTRNRRQFQVNQPITSGGGGYYYGKGQA